MDHISHNKIVSFIWSIADDCLRDVFVRGKYRDVILPMFVLRRPDVLDVCPHVADAWLNMDSVKIGYEISLSKYFYQHTPLRPLAEVTAEILALEQETEGLLKEIVGLGGGIDEYASTIALQSRD